MKYILILDCGGQYTHLIKRVLDNSGYFSKIHAADKPISNFTAELENITGLIISGGSGDVTNSDFSFDKGWLKLGIPVLGICYGHQLIAHLLGGKVGFANREFGIQSVAVDQTNVLLKKATYQVWTSHSQSVLKLPSKAISMARSGKDRNSVVRYSDDIYGVQFHPEVSHSETAQAVIVNFAKIVCKHKKSEPWDAAKWISYNGKLFSIKYSGKKIVLALSGGVDSMTMAAYIRKFHPKNDLYAVYVDNGLNPNKTLAEVRGFCTDNDIQLDVLDEKERFFSALSKTVDPRTKGRIIGREFILCFEEYSDTIDSDYLAQGTIWSDVVESGVTKFSSAIKPHHNVGGIPKGIKIGLVEPFRELFKDQVRAIAAELGLKEAVVQKKVFPGPGFAIRVDGVVTEEKVDKVKKATEIVDEILEQSDAYKTIWMAFPILVNAKSLGVRGDKRCWNTEIIVIRAVESKNSMTVNFSQSIFEHLEAISTRIIEEIDIGRVVYDITNKPPGTIEWQ
jgi:GMP synthase (glutamine-hydrolysing)